MNNKNTMDEVIYWIWLNLTLGAGCKNSSAIIDATDCNAYAIYQANEAQLTEWGVFKKWQIEKLVNKNLDLSESIYNYCVKNRISILTPLHNNFPKLLTKLESCPFVLYVLGTMPDFTKQISVSMVGSRMMSNQAKRSAYEIAYDIARSNIVITSGMALGIDGVCHTAAIESGGTTIAVLGCGIDVVYPSQHRNLMGDILRFGGAVVSEFAPGTKPYGGNFIIRNRIISGMSVGTVVVEAGARSGALNTARHTKEQGRDLFAVPGPAGEFTCMGSNQLLKEGAIAVTEGSDILDHYAKRYGKVIDFRHVIRLRDNKIYKKPTIVNDISKAMEKHMRVTEEERPVVNTTKPEKQLNFLDTPSESEQCSAVISDEIEKFFSSCQPVYRSIYETIISCGKVADQISVELNISVTTVLECLTLMEIEGIVNKSAGGAFIAAKADTNSN